MKAGETQKGDLPDEEARLLRRAAAGSRESFALLYKKYLNPVYRYIYLLSGSKEDSEEVVQDIFVRIWERRKEMAEIRSFRAYLFHMARNRMIDLIRKRQRKQAYESGNPEGPLHARPADHQLIYEQLYHLASNAIAELPPRRKLIFELKNQDGLSLDEIAGQLKISKSVVKKQLYAATAHVKKRLGSYEGMVLFIALVNILN